MDQNKKDRLEGAGWRVGNAEDFLELTREEAAFVELKLALAHFLRDVRVQQGWTGADGEAARVEPIAVRQDGGGGRVRLARSARQGAPGTRSDPGAGWPSNRSSGIGSTCLRPSAHIGQPDFEGCTGPWRGVKRPCIRPIPVIDIPLGSCE
jgi:hypothetical protein